jgi:hypothetical protein
METVTLTETPEPARRTGRPRGEKREAVESRVSLAATPEFQAWLSEFADHLGGVSSAAAVRESLRRTAAMIGFCEPPLR